MTSHLHHLLLLLCLHPAQPLVVNFHTVFTAQEGFGSFIPTAWELFHGTGLGGQTKLVLEGLHMTPPDAVVFLTVVEHEAWHSWSKYISLRAPKNSDVRWQRSMLVCDTPSKVRYALKSNATRHHLDFSKPYTVGMNGEEQPTEIDFFAYGRFTVLLVSCRGDDSPTQRTEISGRLQLLTEIPSQVPHFFPHYNRLLNESTALALSHLSYGESIYPLLWSLALTFYLGLFLHWLFILTQSRTLLWVRSRVVDSRLLILAFVSLGCKVIESSLKLAHYNRLLNGLLYWSSLTFASAVIEAAASSCLLMFLALGALGVTIVRVTIYLREASALSVIMSMHFITGLSQAFCRESASPTAAAPPTSSSSISTLVRDGRMELDQHYIGASTCEVLVFSEYVIQALVMLSIIIALNYNIAKLRLLITGATWGRRTHNL